MSTTVTTTTVSTVADMGLTSAVGLALTLALVALLVGKEIASVAPGAAGVRWRRTLNVGLIPLLLAFAVIVAVKAVEVF